LGMCGRLGTLRSTASGEVKHRGGGMESLGLPCQCSVGSPERKP
jgi:hypothetical protein